MPTPTKGPRLGGGPAHERLLLANLATALFEHDRITTTEAKARRLRPFAERLVTFAKRGDLHARRRVLTVIRDKGVVHRLFTEIAPDVAHRPGGYTRITKIGPRKGDNAPMAVIELVREPYSPKQATVQEAEAATRRAGASRPATDQEGSKEAVVKEEAIEDAPASKAAEAATDSGGSAQPQAAEAPEPAAEAGEPAAEAPEPAAEAPEPAEPVDPELIEPSAELIEPSQELGEPTAEAGEPAEPVDPELIEPSAELIEPPTGPGEVGSEQDRA